MKNNISNYNLIKAFVTKDSSIVKELMAPSMGDIKNISLAEAIVKTGKSTLKHYHENFEEIYFILQGKGKMLLGEETFIVGKGDSIAIPPKTPHKIYNIGAEDLKILCICSPPYTHENTILLE